MIFPTARLYNAPGFWAKTNQQVQKGVRAAINLEGLSIIKTPLPLLDFEDSQTVTWMKIMTDKTVGGQSTAFLDQVPAQSSGGDPTHVRFHGRISNELPPDRPEILKTGYAAFRNQDRGRSLFGEVFWNIDPYSYLALRVKSDGRRYFVNIQTDSIVESDIHQHKLVTKWHRGATESESPAQWETVLIRFHDFVRTNQGFITEPQSEMLRQKVKSIGIGLIDREPGPFSLRIGAIWATNLNERGQLDGKTGWEEGDQGSARLGEVTVEKLARRAEERRRAPRQQNAFGEDISNFDDTQSR